MQFRNMMDGQCAIIMGLPSILSIASSLLYFVVTAYAQGTGLTVDLGYGVYTGVNNRTTGLTVWKGYGLASLVFTSPCPRIEQC